MTVEQLANKFEPQRVQGDLRNKASRSPNFEYDQDVHRFVHRLLGNSPDVSDREGDLVNPELEFFPTGHFAELRAFVDIPASVSMKWLYEKGPDANWHASAFPEIYERLYGTRFPSVLKRAPTTDDLLLTVALKLFSDVVTEKGLNTGSPLSLSAIDKGDGLDDLIQGQIRTRCVLLSLLRLFVNPIEGYKFSVSSSKRTNNDSVRPFGKLVSGHKIGSYQTPSKLRAVPDSIQTMLDAVSWHPDLGFYCNGMAPCQLDALPGRIAAAMLAVIYHSNRDIDSFVPTALCAASQLGAMIVSELAKNNDDGREAAIEMLCYLDPKIENIARRAPYQALRIVFSENFNLLKATPGSNGESEAESGSAKLAPVENHLFHLHKAWEALIVETDVLNESLSLLIAGASRIHVAEQLSNIATCGAAGEYKSVRLDSERVRAAGILRKSGNILEELDNRRVDYKNAIRRVRAEETRGRSSSDAEREVVASSSPPRLSPEFMRRNSPGSRPLRETDFNVDPHSVMPKRARSGSFGHYEPPKARI